MLPSGPPNLSSQAAHMLNLRRPAEVLLLDTSDINPSASVDAHARFKPCYCVRGNPIGNVRRLRMAHQPDGVRACSIGALTVVDSDEPITGLEARRVPGGAVELIPASNGIVLVHLDLVVLLLAEQCFATKTSTPSATRSRSRSVSAPTSRQNRTPYSNRFRHSSRRVVTTLPGYGTGRCCSSGSLHLFVGLNSLT